MPVTKRDKVWAAAFDVMAMLESDEDHGLSGPYGVTGFTVFDVKDRIEGDVSDRTVRDCLVSMVELDVLSVVTSRPRRYQLPKESETSKEDMAKLLASIA